MGSQLAPEEQDTQLPALQTLPLPQGVPSSLSPEALQTGVPVEQLWMPVLHVWLGEQVVPSLHVPQFPEPSQTLPLPQPVPAATVPVSTQTGLPVEQSVEPVLQGAEAAQLPPCVQATHAPLPSQTCPWPQEIPAATKPVSLQTGLAPLQSTVPVRHAVEAAQLAPC